MHLETSVAPLLDMPISESQTLLGSKTKSTPGAFPSTPESAELPSPSVVSSQLSLSQAVRERRAEYTRPRKLRIKVGTWNVASLSGTEKDVGGWFVDGKGVSESLSGLDIRDDGRSQSNGHKGSEIESVASQEERRSKKRSTVPKNDPGSLPGGDEIGLYVLGLQEIVDIGSVAEALRPYSDPHPSQKWKQAITDALPNGYQRVAEQQLIGLFLVIYASSEIASTISSVSTTSVGTGLGGYMGNKGAVTARIVLGETTRMVFVNCHLTAGVEKGNVERRNWDALQILQRTKFDPVDDGGGVTEEFSEGIGDEDFAFWFGDLNYRLESMPAEDVRRLLMLHTRNEYGVQQSSRKKIDHELANPESLSFARSQEAANRPSDDEVSSNHTAVESSSDQTVTSSIARLPSQEIFDPASDPASLHTTLSSLLVHDQLHSQMLSRKAFHDGWQEGNIDFLPTYKYDVGSVGMFDSSEKQRGPSWCDRILYRTRKDRLQYEQMVQDEEVARKKDNEMKLQGVVDAVTDESVLFDYDPETDGADNEDNEINEQSAVPEIVTTQAGFEDKLCLEYYKSHQRILSSDHKPLDAVFTLDYDAVDPELKAKIHQEVARELDKAENEGRPVVTIVVDHQRDSDSTRTDSSSSKFEGVDFGHVKYDHVKTRSVTIANTGRVPATVGFVDRPVESGQPGGVAPLWLKIGFDRPPDNKNSNPGALQEHTLHPGDALNVELTFHVNNPELVRRLSDKVETLEDVLVLRIHNGRDYYLPIRGDWLQSAFGRSIEKLVRMPEGGVRRWQNQRPEGSSHGDEGVKWSAPREIFRLTEAIEDLVERALAQWGMTGEIDKAPWDKDVGWPFRGWISEEKMRATLRESVREALDSDQPFSETFPPESDSLQRLEAVAETFVQFLKSLEDGIVTEELWLRLEKDMLQREKAKKALSDEDERMWTLDTLSTAPAHSVAFTFVTFMLARVVNEVAPPPSPPKAPPPSLSESGNFEDADHVPGQTGARSKRREMEAAYAEIVADAMIRLRAASKGKERKASETRRKHVVEVFLKARSDDGS